MTNEREMVYRQEVADDDQEGKARQSKAK